MADIKISDLLPASTPLDGTETLPIVQSGNTVKASTQDIASLYSLGYTAEDVANKSTDTSFAGATDLKYPSQLAVKTYVDNTLGNSGWGLSGNSGTTSANFIGTTDSQDLVLKTSGVERLRVDGASAYGYFKGNLFAINGTNNTQIGAYQNSGGITKGVILNNYATGGEVQIFPGNATNSLTLKAPILSTNKILTLPNTNGTLVATVNGTAPDSSGNVTVSGGGNTTTVKISLTSAQLQSISGSNEIVLIPVQAGKVICPISTFAVYDYGTVAYTSGVSILLKLASGSGASIGNINFGSATFDIVTKLNNNNTLSSAGLALNNYIAIGAISSGSMGTGDGTLDLYITYAVI
jgi:hypothetical protein